VSVVSLAGMRLVQCGRLNCVTNILACFGTRMLCGVALGVDVGVGGVSVCASEVGGARRRAGGNACGSVTVYFL
jgi:hypothetical protein